MAYNFYNNYAKNKESNNGLYLVLLYFSYVWVSFYPVIGVFASDLTVGLGKLFNLSSGNLFIEAIYILLYPGINMLLFEIIFWFYRVYLSTKVYTFVVPTERLKQECRIFFIIRNIFYGIFLNLCFLYPFIYKFDYFINVSVTLIVAILFAYKMQKEYSEPIISHFVFKNFCYPIFYYEIFIVILNVLGVM